MMRKGSTGYIRARRIHDLLASLEDVEDDSMVPDTSCCADSSVAVLTTSTRAREVRGAVCGLTGVRIPLGTPCRQLSACRFSPFNGRGISISGFFTVACRD